MAIANLNLPYDETSATSIEAYSKKAMNRSFRDILMHAPNLDKDLESLIAYYDNPRGKGGLGNLIEKYFFFYEPNSDSAADFPLAGVELKVTPYQKLKNKNVYRSGERLVISMIPYSLPLSLNIEDSHIMEKIDLILLMLYMREEEKKRTEYLITHSQLFSITSKLLEEDFKIIKEDYKKIVTKIQNGEAHLLSESDTNYLAASTKGSTAKKSLQPQYYNPDIKAKRRAFSFKQGFMTYIINNYIFKGKETYESIIHEPEELTHLTFDEIVINKLNAYIGYTESQLINTFNIKSKAKNILSTLAFRMLGITSNNAEEFVKSNTVVKTIRVEQNGSIREHMSFPTFKIKELLEEEWEDSWFYDYFSETKFLFIVYKHDGEEYVFSGSKFWNFPIELLEGAAKEDWIKVRDSYKNISFYPKKNQVSNSLPKPNDVNIAFSKLHIGETAHIIDGIGYGKGLENYERYTDTLPNGDRMPIQSFWLKKKFIAEQIKEYL